MPTTCIHGLSVRIKVYVTAKQVYVVVSPVTKVLHVNALLALTAATIAALADQKSIWRTKLVARTMRRGTP